MVWVAPVHAIDLGIVEGLKSALIWVLCWILNSIASMCFSISIFFMRMLIEIASYNGYLSVKAVTVGWVALRDIGNIFLVIVLLVIAMATIIGVESYEWRKMLTKFIMAAILVNFSRQICAFIIDAAQVVVMTFANGLVGVVGNNIIETFNVKNAFTFDPGVDPADTQNSSKQLMTAMMTAILAVVLAVTFAVYCFIFVARMVMLWVLIALSPLAFFLSVLPQTQKYATQWWTEFINNVIMGPVIIFFLWLSMVTLSGGSISSDVARGSNLPMSDATSSEGGEGLTGLLNWSSLTTFIIGIGMLLAGVKVGQQIGGAGAGAMSKISDTVKKSAMALTGAGAAMWAGKKGGKWAAMNMPVVGGNAWKRRGTIIAGLATGLKGKIDTKRDSWLGGLEGKADKAKGWRRALGKIGTGALSGVAQSGKMADRKAATYKEYGENWQKIHDSSITTTPTWGSKLKAESEIGARKAGEFAAAKTKQKSSEAETRLAEAAKAGKGGQLVGRAKYFTDETARVQNEQEELDTASEARALHTRADAYRVSGDIDRATALERRADSLPFDKIKEALKPLNGKELVGRVGALAKDLIDKRAKASGPFTNPEEQQKAQKEYQKAQRQLFAARNLATGHDEDWVAKDADAEIMKAAGISATGKGNTELSLSLDLAKDVSATSAKAELEHLNTTLSGGVSNQVEATTKNQAIYRERRVAEKHALTKGLTEHAGNSSDTVQNDGTVLYSLHHEDVDNTRRDGDIDGFKKYLKPSQMEFAPASATERNGKGEINKFSDKMKELMTIILKGKTAQGVSNLNPGIFEDLDNTDTTAISQPEIKLFFDDMEKVMEHSGFESFKKMTAKLFAKT